MQQATRTVDLIAEQKRRQRNRERLICIPGIVLAAAVLAYAIVGMVTPS